MTVIDRALGLPRHAIEQGDADDVLAPLSDTALSDAVAATTSTPKVAPADSFVLHSGLELLARVGLLPTVAPAARSAARRQILALAADYAQAGPEVAAGQPPSFPSPAQAVAALRAAIETGDLDGTDAPAAWLASAVSPVALAEAAAPLSFDRLGAAGHGAIWSFLLPRVASRQPSIAATLRPLARELAREHTWRLTWPYDPDVYRPASPYRSLSEALAEVTIDERPENNFIYPTMHLVEGSGLAAGLLGPLLGETTVGRASAELARIAAHSMLQDDPAHAPYGWSHCLTMPQATLGVAHWCPDTRAAIAVAATYVLGFRATISSRRLDPGWEPAPPAGPPGTEQLEGPPEAAAAAAWHAPQSLVPAFVGALASYAAGHADAHLAKYTLACFDATAHDPGAGRLYLAAAAYLGAWWRHNPDLGIDVGAGDASKATTGRAAGEGAAGDGPTDNNNTTTAR